MIEEISVSLNMARNYNFALISLERKRVIEGRLHYGTHSPGYDH